VVGYPRPVNQRNEGKIEEFKQQKTFKIEQGAGQAVESAPTAGVWRVTWPRPPPPCEPDVRELDAISIGVYDHVRHERWLFS